MVCPKYLASWMGLFAGFVDKFSFKEIVMSNYNFFDLLACMKSIGLFSGSASPSPVLLADAVM